MARTVNETEYAARRNEILDVAHRLVQTKGYEQMTIRDIMDELQISKGALYHYFSSKQAVLEALTERIVEEAEQLVVPIVRDPHRTGLEKLQHFFSAVIRWKSAQKPFMVALLRVWYADDNAIVRQKVAAAAHKRFPSLLAAIIQQGTEEGVFRTAYPEQTGKVILSLILSLQETVTSMVLSFAEDQDEQSYVENAAAAYVVYLDALERVLGAPTGSLYRRDVDAMKDMVKGWVVSLRGDEGR
jgi:AcrR family transcriptional regulator